MSECVYLCWGWGCILFWKQMGLQVKRPVLFIVSQQRKLFLWPPPPCLLWVGKEGKKEITAAEQTRAAGGEPGLPRGSFPLALLSFSESRKIIKALIYLYIFSIDSTGSTIAASLFMRAEPSRSPGGSQRPSVGPRPLPGGGAGAPLSERGPGRAVSPAAAEQWLVS